MSTQLRRAQAIVKKYMESQHNLCTFDVDLGFGACRFADIYKVAQIEYGLRDAQLRMERSGKGIDARILI